MKKIKSFSSILNAKSNLIVLSLSYNFNTTMDSISVVLIKSTTYKQ